MAFICSKKTALYACACFGGLFIFFQLLLSHYAAFEHFWNEIDLAHNLEDDSKGHPEQDIHGTDVPVESLGDRWEYLSDDEKRQLELDQGTDRATELEGKFDK